MNSHEDPCFVALGGLHLQRGEDLGFIEEFLQRGCVLRSDRTLYRRLIDASLHIGSSARFSGGELHLRGDLRRRRWAQIGREQFGLEQVAARIGRGIRLCFIDARAIGREANQIGGCFESCDGGGRERRRLSNKERLFAVFVG